MHCTLDCYGGAGQLAQPSPPPGTPSQAHVTAATTPTHTQAPMVPTTASTGLGHAPPPSAVHGPLPALFYNDAALSQGMIPGLPGTAHGFSASLQLGAHKQYITVLFSSCIHWPLAAPPSTSHSWIRPACCVHSLGVVLPTHFRRRGTPCWASSGDCSILQQQ
jgi:hypothetical protein